jgi:NAD(P)-dependent dehydrogenase (short-subunit alcohol dehydrogenase family)
MTIADTVVLVTGANRGIGQALSQSLRALLAGGGHPADIAEYEIGGPQCLTSA